MSLVSCGIFCRWMGEKTRKLNKNQVDWIRNFWRLKNFLRKCCFWDRFKSKASSKRIYFYVLISSGTFCFVRLPSFFFFFSSIFFCNKKRRKEKKTEWLGKSVEKCSNVCYIKHFIKLTELHCNERKSTGSDIWRITL